MGEYYLFLSCYNISIEGTHIKEYLEDRISREGISIGCICNQGDLESFKDEIDDLEGSSVYVVNTNEEPNCVKFWEIGYAMGKGLKIIGYPGEESKQKIPEDMKKVIGPIPKDIKEFVKKISRTLTNLSPKDTVIKENEWDRQSKLAKKENGDGIYGI